MDRHEQGEGESARRAGGLIVPVLLVVTVMGVAVALSSRNADTPRTDLQAKVVAVVPAGITVRTADGVVYLSGAYDGDLDDLAETVATIEGVARVITDSVRIEQAAELPTVQTNDLPNLKPASFRLEMDRDSVNLSGILSSAEVILDIEQMTQRVAGLRSLRSQLEVGLVGDPVWISGLTAVIEAALNSDMVTFEFDISENGARASGIARDQISADELIEDLSHALGFDPVSIIDVRDLPRRITALLRGVTTFESGSADLSEEGRSVLAEAATLLLEAPAGIMRVIGHTDSIGDRIDNQILSEERAQAVVDYLVSEGVPASQLSAVGSGEARPIASNDNEDGRSQNRRIEFVVGG